MLLRKIFKSLMQIHKSLVKFTYRFNRSQPKIKLILKLQGNVKKTSIPKIILKKNNKIWKVYTTISKIIMKQQ